MRPDAIEDLAVLAQLSWTRAAELCSEDRGCTAYHRLWSTARLLIHNGRPPASWRVLHDVLSKLPTDGVARVLIAGSADAGLLANVLSGLMAAGREASVVVSDQCLTPLEQCRVLAERLGREVELIQCDARAVDCAPVDLIYAHSFIPFLAAEHHLDLLTLWARLLKPGGGILIHNALDPEPGVVVPQPDEAQAELQTARLIEGAVRAGRTDLEDLRTAGLAYWSIPPNPRLNEPWLRGLLAQAGLQIEWLVYDGDRAPSTRWQGSMPDRIRANVLARLQPGGQASSS